MTREEEFGRNVIREIIGKPTHDGPPARFTLQDLRSVRDFTHKRFRDYPSRIRIAGMVVDLSEGDKLYLANFEAAIEVANRLGLIDRSRLERVMPDVYTAVQIVDNDETYGTNMTQQKK